MDLDQIIDNIGKLPEQSKNALKEIISEVTHPKGHILFRADKIETKVYFIKKGIVRAYTELADNEITFWFGREGDTVVSMKSYVSNQRGYTHRQLGKRICRKGIAQNRRKVYRPTVQDIPGTL